MLQSVLIRHSFCDALRPTATHPPAGRQPVASPQIGTRVPLLYSNRGLGLLPRASRNQFAAKLGWLF